MVILSSLVLVFFCFILLLIAMSCHCPFCVRLSNSIKITYLLTYLLKYKSYCSSKHILTVLLATKNWQESLKFASQVI